MEGLWLRSAWSWGLGCHPSLYPANFLDGSCSGSQMSAMWCSSVGYRCNNSEANQSVWGDFAHHFPEIQNVVYDGIFSCGIFTFPCIEVFFSCGSHNRWRGEMFFLQGQGINGSYYLENLPVFTFCLFPEVTKVKFFFFILKKTNQIFFNLLKRSFTWSKIHGING